MVEPGTQAASYNNLNQLTNLSGQALTFDASCGPPNKITALRCEQNMDNARSLADAKQLIKEGRVQEAIPLYQRIAEGKSLDAAEAAYSLGILHHSGNGVPRNDDEAEKYYRFAEQLGYPLATYRLAVIYYRRHELKRAFKSFRSVAEANPSAAYWAYRLLLSNPDLAVDRDALQTYLNMAAEHGHVVAQRDLATSYILGRRGISKIPYGLLLYGKAIVAIFRVVVLRNDKMKYQ